MRIIVILALVASAAACDKGGGGKGGPTASSRDGVIAAWKTAGLTPSPMTADKTGAIGDDCVSGTVSGVDVVLCTFAKPEDATAAVAKGYTWVGSNTGTSLAQGTLVVAAADRRSADPTGRTINTIAKSFTGK